MRFAAALLLAACAALPARAQKPADPFMEAFEDIQRRYVDESKVKTERLVGEALKGIVAKLDSDSWLEEPGTKPVGPADPGLVVGLKEGMALVMDVAEGGQAEAAGCRPGDRIIRIDGEAASGKKGPEVERMLAGAAGTRVRLLWANPRNEFKETALTRSPTARPAWRRFRLDGFEVVQVFRFDGPTGGEIAAALGKLGKAEVSGVLLDLRQATAGEYDSALALADSLMGAGEILAIGQSVNPDYARTYQAKRKSGWTTVPLVVAAGRWTRGPAEVLAAALAGNKRAMVVGEPTFGSAGRQAGFPVEGGRTLHLTVERFLTPLSLSITGAGVQPDLKMEEPGQGETALMLERRRVPERFLEALFRECPAEYDPEALQRGEVKLIAASAKGKSSLEQRIEFEQTFQIALESLLREMELEPDKDDLEELRPALISRVRILAARARMKPAEAVVAAMREDRTANLAMDSLKALVRLKAGQ